MTQSLPSTGPRLLVPALDRVYLALQPVAVTLMRVLAGIALITHGWPKIQNPTGMAGMVEGLGFAPGAFWSSALAVSEFFGGILLVLGLFTRPAAFVTLIVLLVTVYTHWIVWEEGFSGAELSILWSTILFYFVVHGANRYSVDAVIGKQI